MKRLACLAAVCVGALLPVGCAEKPVTSAVRGYNPAQKWEYKVVKIDKNEERDLTTLLNLQAKDGWEYTNQITTDAYYLVFQRATGQGVRFSTAPARTFATKVTETRAVPRPTTPVPPPVTEKK